MKARSQKTAVASQSKRENPAEKTRRFVTKNVNDQEKVSPGHSHFSVNLQREKSFNDSRKTVKSRNQIAPDSSQVNVNRRKKIAPAFSQKTVTDPGTNFKTLSQLVLSVFHGADLFGKGFEQEGFCVVRAGEISLGFDVRQLRLVKGKFDGIIGGSPCQDFSLANRNRNFDGYGIEMLKEFARLVLEAEPEWFLLENVPSVPQIEIKGYEMQRFYLNASECGLKQNRLRYFQFGHRAGKKLLIKRQPPANDLEPCAMASEGKNTDRRGFSKFCELQGLPKNFDLKYFKTVYKYEVVGNGVPPPMAQIIAAAIRETTSAKNYQSVTFCACDCGREVTGRQKYALARCRKRAQLDREASADSTKRVFTFPM